MTMDAGRWERIQALFHGAADLPAEEQRAFLERECVDPDLAADVLAMLAEDARGSSLLDSDIAYAAREMLGGASAGVPAEQFGRYRIKEMLGEGGMGVVYLAERTDLGGLVAIKILRDAWLSPARRERFANEQRTLARLNHPAIARIYDANTLEDGTPWFVMEYVEGVPLTDYCETHASSIPERLRLFRAICEAVEYAHRHLVIHRDLKPSNILARTDGSVVLLDFGISKQLEGLDVPVDQTRTGLRFLTPAYAAPEQLRGDQAAMQTDVYSLGVVLYELLTGRLPFDLANRTPGEAETIILEHEPVKPSAVARRVAERAGDRGRVLALGGTEWADLDVLCLTAMHKDPTRRYGSAEALIRDIDRFLNGEPLEARSDSVRYRVSKFVTRHRRPLAAAMFVFTAVVALTLFYTVRLTRARNAAVAEAARTQRIQRFMLDLFQGGDDDVGPSDSLRVVSLLERGVRDARALDAEPAVQAELYQTLGSLYQRLGRLASADTLLRASLAQRRGVYGGDHPDIAGSLIALGGLRQAQARYDEAEPLLRDGLAMSQRTLPPRDPAVVRAMIALGQMLEDHGNYDEAIRVLTAAVRLQPASGPPTSELSASLTELANTHFYSGHYALADSLNRRLVAMDSALYGAGHPHVADDLINLGAVQYEWGRYAEAERFDRQALEIIGRWFGSENQETASAMTLLGRALVAEKKTDEATDILGRALVIEQRVYGPVHPRVASTLNDLGQIALARGQLADAESDFRRMAAIYQTVYSGKHYLIGIAWSNLGSVYIARKDYANAERYLRQAMARYAETLPADHLTIAIGRLKLGRALIHERKYAEAEREIDAGYAIVNKQETPPAKWVEFARADLAILHDSQRATAPLVLRK